MRLVEAGKLNLDAPASKYVPEMASLGPITVRMLLNQVSGIRNYSDQDFAQLQKIDRTPKELLDYILALPKLMVSAPGEKFEYSNSNYVVLGVIAERVSGRPLADLLTDLFHAAKLTNTAVDHSYDVVPHRAEGYTLIDGKPDHFRKAEYFSMDNAGGAGALRSTPTDLAKWHQALLGGRVVKEASFQQMEATGKLRNGQQVYRDDAPIAQGKPAYGFGLEVGMFDGPESSWPWRISPRLHSLSGHLSDDPSFDCDDDEHRSEPANALQRHSSRSSRRSFKWSRIGGGRVRRTDACGYVAGCRLPSPGRAGAMRSTASDLAWCHHRHLDYGRSTLSP